MLRNEIVETERRYRERTKNPDQMLVKMTENLSKERKKKAEKERKKESLRNTCHAIRKEIRSSSSFLMSNHVST